MAIGLIEPHGGQLVNRKLEGFKRQDAFEQAHAFPRITLSQRNIADIECIATGIYSPLEGFVGEAEYTSIVDNMRLTNGLAWSIPVTLQIAESDAEKCRLNGKIALAHPNGDIVAVMTVESKFTPDQDHEAQQVYSTAEDAHPGVKAMKAEGPVYLGGPIEVVNTIPYDKFLEYRLTPEQTRVAFAERGWKTVVAFQTRNPIHRAHEYITKTALEIVDGLFINPLVGMTKSDDIPADVRVKCYETIIEHYYPKERVQLGVFPAAMRYAGPREAIMHAIARQNYGCTHFIVGRDHAGVGDYYGTYDAQAMFENFTTDELKIQPIKFEHAFYCTRTQGMATAKTSSSNPEERIHLSGTKVRAMLRDGKKPPAEFSRPEVAEILIQSMREPAGSAS
ncbi:MAG: sulfate adenylyltransferase [Cyanobacteria bacterium J06598_3]